MPRSKRDKKVDLTKVGKKTPRKKEQIDKVRKYIGSYTNAYVIKFNNPRNQKIAEVRNEMQEGQLIFGKNKVTMLALGRDSKKAYRPEIEKLCAHIKGQCALLLTNLDVSELREKFNGLRSSEFARPGISSAQSVTLAAGALPKFSHTMEPYLRQLGLRVKLVRGIVHLEDDYKVCQRGENLSPEQCKILKMFDVQLSEFSVSLIASWSDENGVVELEESDAFQMVAHLPPAVRVECQKLDDDQYYFVPVACDDEVEEGNVKMEE